MKLFLNIFSRVQADFVAVCDALWIWMTHKQTHLLSKNSLTIFFHTHLHVCFSAMVWERLWPLKSAVWMLTAAVIVSLLSWKPQMVSMITTTHKDEQRGLNLTYFCFCASMKLTRGWSLINNPNRKSKPPVEAWRGCLFVCSPPDKLRFIRRGLT